MEPKNEEHDRRVEGFFSRKSEGYAKSASHAGGSDLHLLVSNLPLSGNSTALDIATGTGFTAIEMAKHLKSVCAIDRTEEMLTQAIILSKHKGLANIDFFTADVSRIPFKAGMFDIVTCRRAAHHFSEKGEFLMEARRVLKAHGSLGIADMIAPAGMEAEYNGFERARDSSHGLAENKNDWKRIVEDAGFMIQFLKVEEERVSFEKWLFPVTESEEGGKKARRFLDGSHGDFKKSISYDAAEDSFLKRRIVIVAVADGRD